MAARRINEWVAIAGLASVTLAAVALPARGDAGAASPAGQGDWYGLVTTLLGAGTVRLDRVVVS